MCFVSTPKLNTNPPPVQYMHNPYLDGANDGTGLTIGRNSLVVMQSAGSPSDTGAVSLPGSPPPMSGAGSSQPNPVASAAGGAAAGVPTMGGVAPGVVPPNTGAFASALASNQNPGGRGLPR
jgi:hypothetical protein